eukprot:CAMPEP_0117536156 /NCGR_PEP_ID=MMETSP0784-20121206/41305_1 /TAXON_ID=39447 /ORGANISM="" /LENGTH=304 /DNA_ID=CAMNT_0005332705 /DNA_START=48 /DNA_END=959 /DNA_ORIENTATION=-
MALWQSLREELSNTVQEFREKGAKGALVDAALDTRDIVKDAGGWLFGGVRDLVGGAGSIEAATELVVRACSDRQIGDHGQLELPPGSATVDVEILALDTISTPPRARVRRFDTGEELVAMVLPFGAPAPPASLVQGAGTPLGDALPNESNETLLGELHKQVRLTVEDIRQKGAVGALQDAALDAIDIVGDVAGAAYSGARGLMVPQEDVNSTIQSAPPAPGFAADASLSAATLNAPDAANLGLSTGACGADAASTPDGGNDDWSAPKVMPRPSGQTLRQRRGAEAAPQATSVAASPAPAWSAEE